MIATAYDLPYDVLIGQQREFVADGSLRISLIPRSALESAAADDFVSLFTAFDVLGQAGALSGPHLAPWESGIENAELIRSERLEWRLSGCRLDERALVVLAQVFLISPWRLQIARIEIGAPPFTPLARLEDVPVPYPTVSLASRIPIVRSGALSDSIRFLSTMSGTVSDEDVDTLSNLLFNSATALGMGLYPVAPQDPQDCGLLFNDELEAVGDELVLSIDKFRAHASAIDALLNVYIAFDQGRGVITRLEVE